MRRSSLPNVTDLQPLTLPSPPSAWPSASRPDFPADFTADSTSGNESGGEAWAAWLRTRCDDQLAEAARLVKELKAPAADALTAWNDIHVALSNCFAAASLMAQVHPDDEIRTQAEHAEVEASRFRTDLMLDIEVYAALAAVDPDALEDPKARRVLELSLRDFRRAGVDRDEATRARLRELNERHTELGQAFTRAIREDARATRLRPEQLRGLPADWIETHPPGEDGLVEVGTSYPDTVPFLSYAEDAEARRAVLTTFLNIAWPDNDAILSELLEVREEVSRLLEYAGWPDYDAEVKMIGSGAAIAEFIDTITADAEAAGRRDLAVLLERARQDDPELTTIDASNWRYYAEVVRRERFDVDAQQVREYFDFPKVRAGLLAVTGRLFGLSWTPVPEAPVWHPDVTAYDVSLEDEGLLGRIYLDLHPRPGKYNHAAQFDLVSGVAGRQLPEGVLVCNFPRGLMEHTDVVTLFHEFGHLVHHVLAGRHRWARFSGVATEWDFVEAPSQLLEEWAWDAAVLQSFAINAAGEPIPTSLVERMRRADEFGKGFLARTQMFYAAISLLFHSERPADLTSRMLELQDRYSLIAPIPDTHFHTGFSHLEGYTSGYYTYMWSLVIAKDLFSTFDHHDLFAPEVARRYRDRVLAPGGSKDAAELVQDFLGRPYDSRAFKEWLDR